LSDNPFIVSLDVGTSSVRTLLFDSTFTQMEGIGTQLRYDLIATPDGGVEIDPAKLLALTIQCFDTLHEQMQQRGIKAVAVGASVFWHSFLGITADGSPTTNITHLFDTRSTPQINQLKQRLDPVAVHERTGCFLHTSYWPAKLLWLSQNRREAFQETTIWLSFGEFLLLRFCGSLRNSTSMASGSGIWNQQAGDYDQEILSELPITLDQLARRDLFDQPCSQLTSKFASRWPLFQGIPWFPASGDGACDSIGSGCSTPSRFALMVGTSGAMRVVIQQDKVQISSGLWCYRVDPRRFILGGALSNGGNVFKWITRTIALPPNAESRIAGRRPGVHGLDFLTFFAGERSPYWRPDLRAAILGMSLATTPLDILQAALEGVALRFGEIYALLTEQFPAPSEVVASGGALLQSLVWSQMMADSIGRPIVACLEQEASGRGAALLAAERVGLIDNVETVPARVGQIYTPKAESTALFAEMSIRQHRAFAMLYPDPSNHSL
jgi:gluconokinase